ncbi:ABC transporter permease [Hydrogenibacillus sp. N12]|uniref:ABC transporter permease n=1 Tax=Hydrogenibacillus sp. N12 TaxID=2866627 RepID=UPI001C7E16FC|nr:ABC transporter permease [Hydrogenibacillus sp. N12]QZA32535.1 ABC transporter permease [Hydrogenibacillus sp. N12]
MTAWFWLVYNEVEKLLFRRRMAVVVGLLAVLIPLFVYAQHKQLETVRSRMGTDDWRLWTAQLIADNENRLAASRLPEEWRRWLLIRNEQLRAYLAAGVDPNAPGAAGFLRSFMEAGMPLFVPLFALIVGSDIISGERSAGTLRLLLSQPVGRLRLALAKVAALWLSVGMILFWIAVLGTLVSGPVFGFGGFQVPQLVGFRVSGETLDLGGVRLIPMWQYLLMLFGLGWYASTVVALWTFFASSVARSTAAGMGAVFAFLLAGSVLANYASGWRGAKWVASTNLDLGPYLAGLMPPIEGLTPAFALGYLGATGALALGLALWRLTRDVP